MYGKCKYLKSKKTHCCQSHPRMDTVKVGDGLGVARFFVRPVVMIVVDGYKTNSDARSRQ